MPGRALFAAFLVAVASLAPAVAAACLPDQSWLGGYFSGEDDDEILQVVADDACAVLPPEPPHPQLSAITLASRASVASADVVAIPSFSPRAPPHA